MDPRSFSMIWRYSRKTASDSSSVWVVAQSLVEIDKRFPEAALKQSGLTHAFISKLLGA